MKERTKPGQASITTRYSMYRSSAKVRNIEFLLSRDEFEQLAKQDCHYCGASPSPFNKYYRNDGKRHNHVPGMTLVAMDRQWVKINGIDRTESDKGYSMDNCVPCCAKCNYFKLDSSKSEFLQHVHRISDHQRGIK